MEQKEMVAGIPRFVTVEALEKPEIIDPEAAYQQAISLAHDEDVSEWGSAISAWLNQRDQPISLLKLQRSLRIVQVWLALLLNGFKIEQRGEFYQTEHVWILRSTTPK